MEDVEPEHRPGSSQDNDDDNISGTCSDVSSVVNNGSVISNVPDRHGFFGGAQYCPDE